MTSTTESVPACVCEFKFWKRERHVHEILDINHFLSNDGTTLLSNNSTSTPKILDSLRVKDPNRQILAHLNINSVRNKLDLS